MFPGTHNEKYGHGPNLGLRVRRPGLQIQLGYQSAGFPGQVLLFPEPQVIRKKGVEEKQGCRFAGERGIVF